MRLTEIHDWYTHLDEDPLYRWQRLLATPDPDLPHPALLKKPRRRSVLRYVGKPSRFSLVAHMLRAHVAWSIVEKRGESHIAQAGSVRVSRLSLVRPRGEAQAG